jgi:hypothetical protein
MDMQYEPCVPFSDLATDIWQIFQATVAYYLLLDNRFRATSGYLGADYQDSMVSTLYIRAFKQDKQWGSYLIY